MRSTFYPDARVAARIGTLDRHELFCDTLFGACRQLFRCTGLELAQRIVGTDLDLSRKQWLRRLVL